ncbi:MAG: type II secretion system protein [Acidobacteria bacterium]|nr:type II secretion system protein [Acidobacteriota bacterium]
MKEDGFSLIELLIVVAIMGILASIAVPHLLRSRQAAYEANAMRYIRSWSPGQELYKRAHGYYADTDEIMVTEGFISKGLKAGSADDAAYNYSIDSESRNPDNTPNTTLWWGRARRKSGYTGMNSYYVDQTGVIRYALGGNANSTDPPIE